MWIAPAKSRSFSVSVVFPASGCEMIAKVRRRVTSWATDISGAKARAAPARGRRKLRRQRKVLFLQDFAAKREPSGARDGDKTRTPMDRLQSALVPVSQ